MVIMGYNKFTSVTKVALLFTIFIEIRITVGKLAVGSFGLTKAANRQPLTCQPNFDENAIGN
jgi:hypothetical protein